MPKENKQTEALEPEIKVPPMQHWHLMDTFGNNIYTEFQLLRIDAGIFTGYKLSNDGINYYATILVPFDKLVSAKLISIEEPDEEEIIEPVKKPKRKYNKRKAENAETLEPERDGMGAPLDGGGEIIEEDNATHVDPIDEPLGHQVDEEQQQANDPMKPENNWPAETVSEEPQPTVEEEQATTQVAEEENTNVEGEGRVQES